MLFETRMGCLNDVVPEETQKFIFSVGEMFRLSPILILFPKSLWPYMPVWKHFVAVWDHLFKVGKSISIIVMFKSTCYVQLLCLFAQLFKSLGLVSKKKDNLYFYSAKIHYTDQKRQ